MAFKLIREQLTKRAALAAELRDKARALNIAIAAFNRDLEPLARAVAEAQDDYNEVLETARALASSIAGLAQEQFDTKSERWQNGEKGTQVRNWIEQWEMSLDDIDLELPEALAEVDPEEQAGELEDTPARPTELEHVRLQ